MTAEGTYEFESWEQAFKKQKELQEYCLAHSLDFKDAFLVSPPYTTMLSFSRKYKIYYLLKVL